jgi:hypothetical protein
VEKGIGENTFWKDDKDMIFRILSLGIMIAKVISWSNQPTSYIHVTEMGHKLLRHQIVHIVDKDGRRSGI